MSPLVISLLAICGFIVFLVLGALVFLIGRGLWIGYRSVQRLIAVLEKLQPDLAKQGEMASYVQGHAKAALAMAAGVEKLNASIKQFSGLVLGTSNQSQGPITTKPLDYPTEQSADLFYLLAQLRASNPDATNEQLRDMAENDRMIKGSMPNIDQVGLS